MFKTRNRKRLSIVVSLAVILSLVAVVTSSSVFADPLAQSGGGQAENGAPPEPGGAGDAANNRSENGIPDEPPSVSEEPAAVEISPEVVSTEVTPDSPDAPVALDWAVQGRLTDASGRPIDGTRTITMRLYSAPTGGTPLCEDEDAGISVVNGLFDFIFDFCTTADISGTQLYLGMQVLGEATEMTPRQPVRPVPYAASLANGAVIGSFKSTATSEIAVSPLKALESGSSNLTISPWSDGYVRVAANNIGTHYAYIPVDVPSRLFGTSLKLLNFKVCYQTSNALTKIDTTVVRYATDTGGYVDQISDATDRNSTAWYCYTVTDATPITIGGAVMVRFVLYFSNTGHYINIGNIKLTLTEN